MERGFTYFKWHIIVGRISWSERSYLCSAFGSPAHDSRRFLFIPGYKKETTSDFVNIYI